MCVWVQVLSSSRALSIRRTHVRYFGEMKIISIPRFLFVLRINQIPYYGRYITCKLCDVPCGVAVDEKQSGCASTGTCAAINNCHAYIQKCSLA